MTTQDQRWTRPDRWVCEEPIRCEECGETFQGREASYLPYMCERKGCPADSCPGRGELVTVAPASRVEQLEEALREIAEGDLRFRVIPDFVDGQPGIEELDPLQRAQAIARTALQDKEEQGSKTSQTTTASPVGSGRTTPKGGQP